MVRHYARQMAAEARLCSKLALGKVMVINIEQIEILLGE
jgi:hypothetical protein